MSRKISFAEIRKRLPPPPSSEKITFTLIKKRLPPPTTCVPNKQQLENWGDDKNCEFIPEEENWQNELDMPSFHLEVDKLRKSGTSGVLFVWENAININWTSKFVSETCLFCFYFQIW
jgi:hypothetical protein